MVASKFIIEYVLPVEKITTLKGWFLRILKVDKCIDENFIRIWIENKCKIADAFTGETRMVEDKDAVEWEFSVVKTGEEYVGDNEYVGSVEDWHVFVLRK